MSELKSGENTQDTAKINSEALYELLGGMYIQLLRIYDLLGLIASGESNTTKVEQLISLHESGKVLSPDPALIIDDDEQDNGSN
jgi:hypothetical protein